MADAPTTPDDVEARARWGDFAWTEANAARIDSTLATYSKLLTA